MQRKLARGVWLHKLLMDSAEIYAGVDINAEGVRYLVGPHVYLCKVLTMARPVP